MARFGAWVAHGWQKSRFLSMGYCAGILGAEGRSYALAQGIRDRRIWAISWGYSGYGGHGEHARMYRGNKPRFQHRNAFGPIVARRLPVLPAARALGDRRFTRAFLRRRRTFLPLGLDRATPAPSGGDSKLLGTRAATLYGNPGSLPASINADFARANKFRPT